MNVSIKSGTYYLSVHDNVVSKPVETLARDYLLNSEWCCHFYDPTHGLFYPKTQTFEFSREHPSAPRMPMAWDETSLEHRANPVFNLWLEISSHLDNAFAIDGVPEGMTYMTGISPVPCVPKPDGSPGMQSNGWRVYGDGSEHERRAHTKSIHRDSIYLDQDCYYTLVWFANELWHPQYYGETLFHSNDANTGDYTGLFEKDQNRGYPIGDVENTVAPQKNRFMLFDSRYLHQVKNVAIYAPQNLMAVSFRLKQIKPLLMFADFNN